MKSLTFLSLFLLLASFSVKAQQNIKVGDIYTFDDNTQGVVFYVDGKGHGLVVSFYQEKRKWEDESHYVYCQDIIGIANEETASLELNYGLGKYNTSYILQQLGETKPTAAKYSRKDGVEWYLPSAGELHTLMTANSNNAINDVLHTNKHKEINGWYWTSSEHDNGNAWRINNKGKVKRCSKLALRVYVRAIRQF